MDNTLLHFRKVKVKLKGKGKHYVNALVFEDNEDDIFEVFSNLHVQVSKFGGKKYQNWRKKHKRQKIFKKLKSTEFMELIFSKSG